MATVFRVKALYEYSSPHEDDLNFDAGQIITVTEEEDEDWYCGEYVDDNGAKHEGIFPRNFVEKFEPIAPPRPTRPRPKQEPDAPPPPDVQAPQATVARPPPLPPAQGVVAPAPAPEPATKEHSEPLLQSLPVEQPAPAPAPAPAAAPDPAPAFPPTSPKPREPLAASAGSVPKPKPVPPPVSEKPNSFKDRIAAFNKPAAPPLAPFKPNTLAGGGGGGGGSGASGFIKKPFVAPPPSRNAFVPPPREAPTAKVYRRDEDPEIQERVAENQGQAEKAGLLPSDPQQEGNVEAQPKLTSLKERIALLQKQQLEQAQRHADALANKEKPKKPPKKQLDLPTPTKATEETADLPTSQILERRDTEDLPVRTSVDEPRSARAPPPLPRRQSDGDEADVSGAGETTERQDNTTEHKDNDDTSKGISRAPTASSATSRANTEQAEEQEQEREQEREQEQEKEEEEEEEEEEEGEGEEDIDPEAKRREELRARMAKMSGGMGFHGMFGAPASPLGAAQPKKKAAPKPPTKLPAARDEESTPPPRAPPVPTMMALPGMGGLGKADETAQPNDDEPKQTSRATTAPPVPTRPFPGGKDEVKEEKEEVEEATLPDAVSEQTKVLPEEASAPPPVPEEPAPPPVPLEARPPPPPAPSEARPPPPPVPSTVKSATEGSESDDELDEPPSEAREKSGQSTTASAIRSPPLLPQPLSLPIRSPPSSPLIDALSPSSPTGKRASRPPPPIPGTGFMLPPSQTRPPPPPPGGLSRRSTAGIRGASPTRPSQAGEGAGEVTEYDGDYDTDIASSVPHKYALGALERESSVEEKYVQLPVADAPPNVPPPIPVASTPRTAPPPVPALPELKRMSADAPRAAPPLPPPMPPKHMSQMRGEENYDHNYVPAPGIISPNYPLQSPPIDESMYFSSVPTAKSPPERRIPPQGLGGRPTRPSMDGHRASMNARRSVDLHRPSMESGFIAGDIDLSVQSGWWRQANQVPPVLQGRKDIYFEFDESTSTNQGEKTIFTRQTFVLFQDYSQTIFTARFDPYDPSDVELEQRHEAPPRALRQDQMEEAYDRFGRRITAAAVLKKDQIVGDGTPQSFVIDLIQPLEDALHPISTRSYGALVYSNMANASTQQHDVIRAGDILTIRNARFQGKHGPMHAKYSIEVGKPDHVAVVAEWDGTKKKVRAWEQGRESKKVKQESYKLDDLRSGEVKIWRVVSRSWVGWQRKLP